MNVPTEFDLRGVDDRWELRFDVLNEADSGDDLEIVAARDVDPPFVRYQIEETTSPAWAYADPDANPASSG